VDVEFNNSSTREQTTKKKVFKSAKSSNDFEDWTVPRAKPRKQPPPPPTTKPKPVSKAKSVAQIVVPEAVVSGETVKTKARCVSESDTTDEQQQSQGQQPVSSLRRPNRKAPPPPKQPSRVQNEKESVAPTTQNKSPPERTTSEKDMVDSVPLSPKQRRAHSSEKEIMDPLSPEQHQVKRTSSFKEIKVLRPVRKAPPPPNKSTEYINVVKDDDDVTFSTFFVSRKKAQSLSYENVLVDETDESSTGEVSQLQGYVGRGRKLYKSDECQLSNKNHSYENVATTHTIENKLNEVFTRPNNADMNKVDGIDNGSSIHQQESPRSNGGTKYQRQSIKKKSIRKKRNISPPHSPPPSPPHSPPPPPPESSGGPPMSPPEATSELTTASSPPLYSKKLKRPLAPPPPPPGMTRKPKVPPPQPPPSDEAQSANIPPPPDETQIITEEGPLPQTPPPDGTQPAPSTAEQSMLRGPPNFKPPPPSLTEQVGVKGPPNFKPPAPPPPAEQLMLKGPPNFKPPPPPPAEQLLKEPPNFKPPLPPPSELIHASEENTIAPSEANGEEQILTTVSTLSKTNPLSPPLIMARKPLTLPPETPPPPPPAPPTNDTLMTATVSSSLTVTTPGTPNEQKHVSFEAPNSDVEFAEEDSSSSSEGSLHQEQLIRQQHNGDAHNDLHVTNYVTPPNFFSQPAGELDPITEYADTESSGSMYITRTVSNEALVWTSDGQQMSADNSSEMKRFDGDSTSDNSKSRKLLKSPLVEMNTQNGVSDHEVNSHNAIEHQLDDDSSALGERKASGTNPFWYRESMIMAVGRGNALRGLPSKKRPPVPPPRDSKMVEPPVIENLQSSPARIRRGPEDTPFTKNEESTEEVEVSVAYTDSSSSSNSSSTCPVPPPRSIKEPKPSPPAVPPRDRSSSSTSPARNPEKSKAAFTRVRAASFLTVSAGKELNTVNAMYMGCKQVDQFLGEINSIARDLSEKAAFPMIFYIATEKIRLAAPDSNVLFASFAVENILATTLCTINKRIVGMLVWKSRTLPSWHLIRCSDNLVAGSVLESIQMACETVKSDEITEVRESGVCYFIFYEV